MDNVKIVSLNTRGMGDCVKRRRVYRYLKRNNADIALLQETHCEKSKEHIWTNEWGNKCLYSNGSSTSRGVAILFRKRSANWVSEVRRDMDGRYILCKVTIGEYTYCIANIYVHNNDVPEFFKEVFNAIREMDCIHVIMGGDFNVVIDPAKDRSVNKIYNRLSQECILKEINEHDLLDAWRVEHPENKCFTWMRGKSKNEWSQIDYILVSGNLGNRTKSSEILPSVLSDHSLISIVIDTSMQSRGPGS